MTHQVTRLAQADISGQHTRRLRSQPEHRLQIRSVRKLAGLRLWRIETCNFSSLPCLKSQAALIGIASLSTTRPVHLCAG